MAYRTHGTVKVFFHYYVYRASDSVMRAAEVAPKRPYRSLVMEKKKRRKVWKVAIYYVAEI